MEYIVVDSNKVLAAFIKEGIVHDLLFSGKFIPVGPEKLLEEIKKHKQEVAYKSGMKIEDVELALSLIEFEFKIFEREKYSDKLEEAIKLAPHPKDVEFFALALKLGCAIWSNEKDFKKQGVVRVLSTKELKDLLEENT